MIITNNAGLPASLVHAVEFSDRNREGCDWTITELLKPARIVALERQYADRISEDAADRLWMLLGSVGHEVLKRYGKQSGQAIVEERAVVDIGGFKIGGQIDYAITDHVMTDFKFTSLYAAKEGPREDWIQQLNCYRWLAHQYGVEVERLQIVCIFRDWSKSKAARTQDYPQSQVKVFDLPIWDHAATEDFIKARIWIHEQAKKELPLCSADEMWERPATWAVKKKGAVRATKIYYDEASAELHAQKAGLEVECRPAERPRCESYCRVAQFCSVWKQFAAGVPGSLQVGSHANAHASGIPLA